VPESSEVRALVEQGYLRMTDIAPILGVTIQRVSQIIAERETSPGRRKWSGSVVCGCEGTWSGGGMQGGRHGLRSSETAEGSVRRPASLRLRSFLLLPRRERGAQHNRILRTDNRVGRVGSVVVAA